MKANNVVKFQSVDFGPETGSLCEKERFSKYWSGVKDTLAPNRDCLFEAIRGINRVSRRLFF